MIDAGFKWVIYKIKMNAPLVEKKGAHICICIYLGVSFAKKPYILVLTLSIWFAVGFPIWGCYEILRTPVLWPSI